MQVVIYMLIYQKYCKFLNLADDDPTHGYSHFVEESSVTNISMEHSAIMIWVKMSRTNEYACYIS
jgi:hypothetical protein